MSIWNQSSPFTQFESPVGFYPKNQLSLETTSDLLAEVRFGHPMANCCRSGICRVELLNYRPFSLGALPERQAYAILKPLDEHRLTFQFPMSGMSLQTYFDFFESGVFQVEGAFDFSRICKVPDCLATISILPGLYAVQRTEKALIVVFDTENQAAFSLPDALVPTCKN